MSVITRLARPPDLATLGELDKHVVAEHLAVLVSAGRVLVAEVDGAVVGCPRWGLFWDEVPFMNLLWVLPDWRGAKVGRTLVDAWETCQSAPGHKLVLTSTVSAETAQHFYRKLGYVDGGALLLPEEPAELILRKHLRPVTARLGT